MDRSGPGGGEVGVWQIKTVAVAVPVADRPSGSVTRKLNVTVTDPSGIDTLLVSNEPWKPGSGLPFTVPLNVLVGSSGSLALNPMLMGSPRQTRAGVANGLVSTGGWFGGAVVGVVVWVGVAGGVVPGVVVGGRVVLRVVVGVASDEDADSLGESDGNDGASVTIVGGSRLASAPTGSAVPSPHAGGGPDAGSRAPFSDTDPDATSAADGSAVSRTAPSVSNGPASVSTRSDSGRNADEELSVLASSRPWLIRTTAVGVTG